MIRFLRGALCASLLLTAAATARAQWQPDGGLVCGAPGNQSGPGIIPDGSGGFVIAWQDTRSDTSIGVYLQRLNNAGVPQWAGNGVSANARVAGEYTFHSGSLIPDGSGGAFIAWIDERGRPSTRAFAQRITGNGAIAPGWPDSGLALTDSGYGIGALTVVSDGSGGAIVVWDDARDSTTLSAVDLYAQRISSGGARMWAANGASVCIRYGQQETPSAIPDGAGGALVTWEDISGDRVSVQHMNSAGTPLWGAGGVDLCDSIPSYRFGAQIASDGAGGGIVTWFDKRDTVTFEDIYARRVNSSGTPQWTANGVKICGATGNQQVPIITPSGSAWVISWLDFRSNIPAELYVQRIASNGTVAWASGGVRIGTNVDGRLEALGDGSGGEFVTWDNAGGGICAVGFPGVVYAQHVTSTGAVDASWPMFGRNLCLQPGGHYSPGIASDNNGGAAVVWHDSRSDTSCDLYATRFTAGGQPTAVDPGALGPGLRLYPPYPNPSSASTQVEFQLPQPARVRVEIVSPLGRRVRVLAAGAAYPAGRHSLSWDGLDAGGRVTPPGFYLIRFEADGVRDSKPLVVLR